jgi:hypothetical protein
LHLRRELLRRLLVGSGAAARRLYLLRVLNLLRRAEHLVGALWRVDVRRLLHCMRSVNAWGGRHARRRALHALCRR